MKKDRELQLFAITAPGLEPVCAGELAACGVAGVRPVPGGVEFRGGLREIYRVNLWLRTASRVVVRMDTFRCRSFPELFQRSLRQPWGQFLRPQTPFTVRASSRGSRLFHTERLADCVREAVCRALGSPVQPAAADGQRLLVRFEDDHLPALRRQLRGVAAPPGVPAGAGAGAVAGNPGGGDAALGRLGRPRGPGRPPLRFGDPAHRGGPAGGPPAPRGQPELRLHGLAGIPARSLAGAAGRGGQGAAHPGRQHRRQRPRSGGAGRGPAQRRPGGGGRAAAVGLRSPGARSTCPPDRDCWSPIPPTVPASAGSRTCPGCSPHWASSAGAAGGLALPVSGSRPKHWPGRPGCAFRLLARFSNGGIEVFLYLAGPAN